MKESKENYYRDLEREKKDKLAMKALQRNWQV